MREDHRHANTGTVRAATLDDVAAIARIHVETWRATYAGILPDAYLVHMDLARQLRMWRHTVRRRGAGYKVVVAALDDGQVVGFASCGAARRGELPRHAAHDGEVYTLYVALDHQGRGHGRRLLNGCFAALRDQGRTVAVVWVLAANPARFFYQAMGGRKFAERIERFAGADLEAYAYGWDLTAQG